MLMEQRCPTRKHMKLKLIFKHRGFMKILSSSQNPGPASPVYLRFQTILPVHFLDFLIISMYGKKPVPRTLLNKPYTSQVPHQTSHILHTCPCQDRGSRSFAQLCRRIGTVGPSTQASSLLCEADKPAGHCFPTLPTCSLESAVLYTTK